MKGLECPHCGKPLYKVVVKIIANWYYDKDEGVFTEENSYTMTRLQLCPHCNQDVTDEIERIEDFDMHSYLVNTGKLWEEN